MVRKDRYTVHPSDIWHMVRRTRQGEYVWQLRLGYWTCRYTGSIYMRHRMVIGPHGIRLTNTSEFGYKSKYLLVGLKNLPELLEAIILEGNHV